MSDQRNQPPQRRATPNRPGTQRPIDAPPARERIPASAQARGGNGNGGARRPPVNSPQRKRGQQMPPYEVAWRLLRPALIWMAAILMVTGVVFAGYGYVYNELFAPVNERNNKPVKIEIARGSSVSSIGRQLVEQELIRNKGVFQYYAEFIGMSGKLKAGTYELSQDMTIKQIITELSMGDGGQQTMRFTLTEGMTIEEMALSLVNQKALTSTREFLDLCASGETFTDYEFIADLLKRGIEGRRYALEGYLFPDTYEIYVGASEETIIRKMLNRTREIYNLNYIDQADEEGWTMDEVLTLASMIEKEGKTADFSKVSAVFHNRIEREQRLESCVTVQYALKMKRLALTAEDMSVESPYNTYKNKGLPVGPIGNPGQMSIDAVIYPDEDFMKDGYLYFCSKDPTTGELQFSKTLAEHEAASEEYRPLWKEFDEKNANSSG